MLETTLNTRRGMVRGDGVDLFVRDWGEGRPIVFLSGWTLSSGMWSYQMAPLAREGFRCVAYDRRAHGRSGDPGAGFDFDTLADDLAAVLDALDLRDVTVVAHSFSGGEIVRYLARHRAHGAHGAHRVGRVLLLAPASLPCRVRRPDNPDGLEPEQVGALLVQLEDDFPGWIEANAEPYFGPGAPRALVDWTVHTMLQTSLLATVELTRVQLTTDFRDALARVDTPTLVIHGDRDASAPLEVTGRPTAELIPGARLVVYEGAPHGLYFTHRHRLNADIAAFAGRTWDRQAPGVRRTAYELTDAGRSLGRAVAVIRARVYEHTDGIRRARAAFDAFDAFDAGDRATLGVRRRAAAGAVGPVAPRS